MVITKAFCQEVIQGNDNLRHSYNKNQAQVSILFYFVVKIVWVIWVYGGSACENRNWVSGKLVSIT